MPMPPHADGEPRHSPRERIEAWLRPGSGPDDPPLSGEWMSTIIPRLALRDISPPSPARHQRLTFAFDVEPGHCNRLGNLHGGCAATLFDLCTTLPLLLVCRPGYWLWMGVSRTLNVTYLRPVPAGMSVLVEAEIVQVGKRVCTLRGVMKSAGGGDGPGEGVVMAVCEHGKVNIDPEADSRL